MLTEKEDIQQYKCCAGCIARYSKLEYKCCIASLRYSTYANAAYS
jgi:hypothetical protein